MARTDPLQERILPGPRPLGPGKAALWDHARGVLAA
jgi:hypothetical protein